jgi:DNA-binding HxlR family transcriptional regulator
MLTPYSILRLWNGKDNECLSFEELLRRKNSRTYGKELSKITTRHFIRRLNELVSMRWLHKEVDSSRKTWYSKTEKGKIKSFTSFLNDWVEREEIGENRDLLGASIICSEPALDNFMREEEIEELYTIMNGANAQIIGKIHEILLKRKLEELSERDRENVVFFMKNIKKFDEMTRRFERSGVVKTQKEDHKVNSQMLSQAKLSSFNTVDEFESHVGDRFNRLFKDYPLTLSEQKEYQDLKTKFNKSKLYGKIFARIEDEIPRMLCCFYNFEMEELLLLENDLVLTVNDMIKPIEEVLTPLSRGQLVEYKERIEEALRSPMVHLPRWVGSDSKVQPKMRLSWDNSTSRKYLKRILLFIEKNLRTSVARSTPENSNHGAKENP